MKAENETRGLAETKASLDRRLTIAILLLACFTLLVGGLSGWFLRGVDRDYSALINEGIPLLNDLQTATRRSADIYTLALELASIHDSSLKAQLNDRMRQALQDNSAIMAETIKMTQTDALRSSYARLFQQRQVFIAALDAFDHLEESDGATPERLLDFNRETLAPAFLAYQKELDAFCDDCQAFYLERNTWLTMRSTHHGWLLWILSFAPLALLGLAALAAIFLMIRLLIRFFFLHPGP